MVGGGQLARMTHQAAIALGQTLRVLAASPDDPAAMVTRDVVVGSHTDAEALARVAEGAAALTFDHEHVPTELLQALVDAGVNVAPPPQALIHAQDKLVMRRRLEELGAPVPRFAEAVDLLSRLGAISTDGRIGRTSNYSSVSGTASPLVMSRRSRTVMRPKAGLSRR
jgi:5-(carboxyamino)imidazole ribonucleotide synthase